MEIHYNKQTALVDNDITYSVDKVVLKGKIHRQHLDDFQRNISNTYEVKSIFDSFKVGTYKHLVVIETKMTTICLKVGFNGFTQENDSNDCFVLEFNPNKLYPSELQKYIHNILYMAKTVRLDMVDIALDIPLPRCMLSLVKDLRNYKYIHTKEGVTEYLGERHTNSACKLYDKTKESHLDTDITRFEISLLSSDDFKPNIPYISLGCIDDIALDNKYKELVIALNHLPTYIRRQLLLEMNTGVRSRVSSFVFAQGNQLYVNERAILFLVKVTEDYFVYPYNFDVTGHVVTVREKLILKKYIRALNDNNVEDTQRYYNILKSMR